MSESTSTANKKLEGKVVIVTGGESGIGEATARLFAEEGACMVVIADIQDELGQSVTSSIGSHSCTYIHCDVTDKDQVKSMVESTVKHYGLLDIMCSNAGIMNNGQTILEMDLPAMDRLFAVNVRGMAACVMHAARAMVDAGEKGGRSIICTTSVGASKGTDQRDDYIMSKHAVLGLVRSTSVEWGKYGIRENCVSPSVMATPMVLKAFGIPDQEMAEKAFTYV